MLPRNKMMKLGDAVGKVNALETEGSSFEELDLEKEPDNSENFKKNTIPLRFLCFNISSLNRYVQLILLSGGVFLFFILHGVVEEYIFKRLPKFEYGWYLTCFELFSFAVFGAFERVTLHGEEMFQRNAENQHHVVVGFAMFAARGLTNISLQYLNYPTQVIFKSLKLLTVMVGSVFIRKRTFSCYDYSSAIMLVSSAILFSLGDVDSSPEFDLMGVIIVSISLVFDAIHATKQDQLMKEYNASVGETMLFTNLYSGFITLFWTMISGELLPALAYCYENSLAYFLFTVRSMVIYCGVLCFLTLMKRFDAVLATEITTVRKILSVMLSFILYGKVWSIKYLYGFLVFVGGSFLSVMEKRRVEQEKEKQNKEVVPLMEMKISTKT